MLTPRDEADLAAAVAGAKGPLAIRGGGTRGISVEGNALSTALMSGITLYEPGALTLVARSGTPVAEIETALAAENQMLAFEPMDHRALMGTTGEPTIGGVVATNASGPRRVQTGACRDFLLGVRFVDGSGTAMKNGGRVMKNVTGYDLTKLMAGSHGTLGILAEVSLKVLPRPETAATLLLRGLSVEQASGAMSAALRSPFEVSGAAHVPEGPEGEPVTMVRVEGFEASVSYRVGRLQDLLAPFGAADIERTTGMDGGRGGQAGWRWVRDAEMFGGTPGEVWRISVKPSDAPGVARALAGAKLLLDWGGGLIWAAVRPGTEVRAMLTEIPGHATLVRATEAAKARMGVFPPEASPLRALAEGLRRRFDPRGILNPGLMG